MRPVSFIPFVCSAGAQVGGTELGAIDLKDSGILEQLSGITASWGEDPAAIYETPFGKQAHGALPPLGSDARKEIVLWHCRHLQEAVIKALDEGTLPVTIGGDHSMALGSISGVAQAKKAWERIGVLWVDAHADFNTPDTSPSQALHGMPLAALTGIGDPDYVALAGARPAVRTDDIVYIGLRDIDPGEQAYIDEFGITAFTMADIERLGIDAVFAKAEEVLLEETDGWALSIDLDSFDPEYVPAVGSPVPQGLRPDDIFPALAQLARDVRFDLVEITEFNPQLPGREQTREFIARLLQALLPVAA